VRCDRRERYVRRTKADRYVASRLGSVGIGVCVVRILFLIHLFTHNNFLSYFVVQFLKDGRDRGWGEDGWGWLVLPTTVAPGTMRNGSRRDGSDSRPMARADGS